MGNLHNLYFPKIVYFPKTNFCLRPCMHNIADYVIYTYTEGQKMTLKSFAAGELRDLTTLL